MKPHKPNNKTDKPDQMIFWYLVKSVWDDIKHGVINDVYRKGLKQQRNSRKERRISKFINNY